MRYQRYLESCSTAIDFDDLDFDILNFRPFIVNILDGTFRASLPPTFVLKVETLDKKNDKGGVQRADKRGSEIKDGRRDDKVENTHQDPAFRMKDSEVWADFSGKHRTLRPVWNSERNEKMCIRFHVQGNSFDGCSNKKSHVPMNEIPASARSNMISFLRACRGSE